MTMAENDSTPAEAQLAPEPPAPAPAEEKTLSDLQLEAFAAAVAADPADAYRRWGVSLFHSLSDEQAQQQLGLLKINYPDALGHYNQGVMLARGEKYAQAAKAFAKAAELDPSLGEALYNQALAEEKAGNTAEARKLWNQYLEFCGDAEESQEIKNHLTELASR